MEGCIDQALCVEHLEKKSKNVPKYETFFMLMWCQGVENSTLLNLASHKKY